MSAGVSEVLRVVDYFDCWTHLFAHQMISICRQEIDLELPGPELDVGVIEEQHAL